MGNVIDQIKDHIAVLSFNRPEVFHAFNFPT